MVENNDQLEFNLTVLDRPIMEADSLASPGELSGSRTDSSAESAYIAKCNYNKKLLESFDVFRVPLRHETLNACLSDIHRNGGG